MTEEEQFAQFESLGEEEVREYIAQGWPEPVKREARCWLKMRRQQREDRAETERAKLADAQANRDAMAATANKRDNIAAATAIIAAVAAIVGAVISTLAWLFPRPP